MISNWPDLQKIKNYISIKLNDYGIFLFKKSIRYYKKSVIFF